MSERPEVHCPTCGAVAQQVFGASGIVFKGSGFYNTDQRGAKGATSATSGGTSSAKSDASAGSSAGEAASGAGTSSSAASGDKPSGSGAKADA